MKTLICLTTIFLCAIAISAIPPNPIKKLRADLLKMYDPLVRPVKNASMITNIRLLLLINQILAMDVKKDFLWLDAVIILKWEDEYINWKPSDYDGLDRAVFDANEVWKPQIEVWNSNSEILVSNILAEKSSITARSNGSMFWWTYITIASKCQFDLKDYPFDRQDCKLLLAPRTYQTNEIKFIVPYSGLSVFGPMTRNPQLAVTNVNSSTYDLSVSARGKFSFMQIDLNIVRRVSIYQYYLQLPFAIAVAFGVCMFLTPSCCWYRNVFAILSILIQMFLLIMIAKQIGIFASTTPSCVIILSANLTLVAISFLISILIKQILLRILIKIPPLPYFLSATVNHPILGRLLLLSTKVELKQLQFELNQDHQHLIASLVQNIPITLVKEWIMLIKIVDRTLFIVFIIISITFHM